MGRRYRRAKRAMRPNRIAARFISGGKHQSFTSIARSPFPLKTVTSKANRREQYRALQRRERQAAQAQRRRQQREAQLKRKQAAAAKKAAPKPPRPPRPKSPPIAVNPRTGKPITYAQAMKALREAQERAERLAAGLPGDPAPKKPRPARQGKTAPRRTPAARKSTPTASRSPSSPAPRAPRKKVGPPPDPTIAPGKNLRGLYMALTCECQGTGRIATITTDGRVTGSTSCPRHGRKARGARKTFARRAMTGAGLPGVAAWLASREGGNRDKQQQRAVRQAERHRYAGPTEQCRACDEGIVNRDLTEKLREQYVERALADHVAAGRKTPSVRKLEAQARKAYPLDHCRECAGLARVPSQHAGDWYRHTNLPQRHRLTAREAATGKQRKR